MSSQAKLQASWVRIGDVARALALASLGKSCSSASGAGSSSVGSSAAATILLLRLVVATSAASAPPSMTMPLERSLST